MIDWFGVRWLDVGWKGVQDGQLVYLGGEGGVQSQDDDAGVGQNTADDDQVVQVGRRHFNLPEEQDDLVKLLYCTTYSQSVILKTLGKRSRVDPSLLGLKTGRKENVIQ